MKNFTDIVFDVDGTLIDTEKIIVEELDRILRDEYGIDKTKEEMTCVLGVPGDQGLRRLGIPEELNAEILARWMGRLDELEDQVEMMPEVTELLTKLREDGYRLGMVTSRDREGIYEKPSTIPLIPYFDYIVTSEDTERHKPEADPLLFYAKKTGAKPDQMMYIGDSEYDMQCAKNAGATAGLAGWGAPGDGRSYADVVLSTPLSLYEYLHHGK